MKNLLLAVLLALSTTLMLQPAQAANEFYAFETAEQEMRFNTLTRELRCPKCQNQSIADSDAPLAMDMRARVYRMVMDGESNQAIIDFMKVRYGDFVHYKPPLKPSTIVLWFAPFIVLLLGVATVVYNLRNQAGGEVKLSEAEQARIAELLAARSDDESTPSNKEQKP
ncbi:cytochrome c-type biogenesis protein [Aliidiomarina celeris]|uniref:cytochrome c-type biogenesis protein n=1 Tax=Aliidiomarina celeris TaxID=2249428 RepID=UPI000DE91354|nr:cytochrome c-type biogenesis protein [Aliidiomarina celeris]